LVLKAAYLPLAGSNPRRLSLRSNFTLRACSDSGPIDVATTAVTPLAVMNRTASLPWNLMISGSEDRGELGFMLMSLLSVGYA